jgi:hypothetical protein
VPHWRPEGSRDLASLSFDDGTTTGIELSARHFGDRVSGWIGYSHSRNTVTDAESGAHYRPISDRPHIFSATFVMRAVRRTTLSAEAFVASGTPFWPFVGDWPGPALRGKSEPWSPGFFTWSRPIAHWADEQERMPTYGRLDVGIRSPFTVRGATVEPFLNIQNASARRAVMYYQTAVPEGSTADDPAGEVVLKPIALPWTVLPTFGFNVRF